MQAGPNSNGVWGGLQKNMQKDCVGKGTFLCSFGPSGFRGYTAQGFATQSFSIALLESDPLLGQPQNALRESMGTGSGAENPADEKDRLQGKTNISQNPPFALHKTGRTEHVDTSFL